MVHVSVDEARVKYRNFLIGTAAGRCEPLVVTGSPHADEFRDLVRQHFADHPDADALEIRTADGQQVGFVARDQISRPDRTAAAGSGDSQGATLPGEPTGYRAVWFKCEKHNPVIWVPMTYYDQRYPPSCPADPVHKTEYVS